jgi:hypothetical protein
VVETSSRESWSADVNGLAETVPRSQRREANSPSAACLYGTWPPRCGLESSSHPIARAGQSRSGYRKAQEANAGTPKGTGNLSPAG